METLNYVIDAPQCMPSRQHLNDAGLELHAKEGAVVRAGYSVIIDTGIHFDIPDGWYGRIETLSGFALGTDLICFNDVISPGNTDTIKVKLHNFSTKHDYTIKRGGKVAQIVFTPYSCPCLKMVTELKESYHGDVRFDIA